MYETQPCWLKKRKIIWEGKISQQEFNRNKPTVSQASQVVRLHVKNKFRHEKGSEKEGRKMKNDVNERIVMYANLNSLFPENI